MLLECADLSYQESTNYADAFETIDFLTRLVLCDEISEGTIPDQISGQSGYPDEVGGKRLIQNKLYVNRDTITNFKLNLVNEEEVTNEIEMIIYQIPENWSRGEKWNTDPENLNDFHELIKNPKSGYKTLSIILYNGIHYTSLIRQSDTPIRYIYFDASSGVEKNDTGDIVLYNMDKVKEKLGASNIQTILYIEKTSLD